MKMPRDNRNPTDREILVNALGVYQGILLSGIERNEKIQGAGEAHERMIKDLRSIADRVKVLRRQVRIGDLTLGH